MPLLAGWLLTLLAAIWTLPRTVWRRLQERDSTHVLFAAIVLLIVIWGLRAGVAPEQHLHFLGVTALYLLFGWQYALLAVAVLVAVTTWRLTLGWQAFGFNFVMLGIIPVAIAHGLLRLSQRYLPHNFFIYIFINSFLAASLGMIVSGLLIYLMVSPGPELGLPPRVAEYPLFLLLLALPEGGLNGMVVTGIVVYRPAWVATFHDRMYLFRQ